MDFLPMFLLLLYIINIAVMITIVFVRRGNPTSTLSWLLLCLLMPYIGLGMYFLIGSTSKIKLISRRCRLPKIERVYTEYVGAHIMDLSHKKIKFAEDRTNDFLDMITMNTKNAMSMYLGNNNVELLLSAQEKFKKMFADIEAATEVINVEYFIFKTKDDIGKQFIALLTKKALEGVSVNVIYDRLGAYNKTRYRDFKELIKVGGKVYKYLPQYVKTVVGINYRLHRKMVIIDREIVYTGGINVGDDYFGYNPEITPWRDTSIRIEGDAVKAFQLRFLYDLIYIEMQKFGNKGLLPEMKGDDFYRKLFSEEKHESGNMGIQVVASGPDTERPYIKDGYIKMITSSKKYVYIQTPYFAPDDTFIDSLILAANSGVDVRLMIPGIADKKFIYYVTMSHIEKLLTEGIKVYVYKGFIHSKTMVMDDHVTSIGTTNLDMRSFALNYEVNSFIYSTSFAEKNKQVFLQDCSYCSKLTYSEYQNRGIKQKFLEGICRLITPIA